MSMNCTDITKIVITGGPCGGKTTALRRIKKVFSAYGYTVIFIPETATEMISGGITPMSCGTTLDFQYHNLLLQLNKETIYEDAARTIPTEKILIVCDRGAMDNKAYMSEQDFSNACRLLSIGETEMRDEYDAVFHLVTAAKRCGYTLEGNEARTETPTEASSLDDRIIAAWAGHRHFRVIRAYDDFEEKIRRLIAEISAFLGIPEPLETERKFLIEYPDITMLEALDNCKKVEIVQKYLTPPDAETEIRIRRRGCEGDFMYYMTEKKKRSLVTRYERETRISSEEYEVLSRSAKAEIAKERYCLVYDFKTLEIDIYPFMKNTAVLEVELSDENEEFEIPPFLRVIREVTGETEYKNRILAERYSLCD